METLKAFALFNTSDELMRVFPANFVEAVQTRQGLYISCIEEIAYKRGFIDREQLLKLAEPLLKTNYGKYLTEVANGL